MVGGLGGPVIFLVAAQIKKLDEHSYSKVTKLEHVPDVVRIPPLNKTLGEALADGKVASVANV